MKGYKQLVVVGILVLAVAIAFGFVGYAIGKGSPRREESARRHMVHRGADFSPELSRAEKIERLKGLHRQDPEKFKKVLAQRGRQVRQRLARLKEEDPKRHKEIVQQRINRLEATLERLKQELPKIAQ